ncbi:hypothetical protein PR202_ga11468 [Eleusine coracana subsp. coracana]|uniref:Uncharacterized protein n=1 Tax=Eleusine coracana subsp. coracana TaxID=191504 RepID=A0AAV5C9K3_ELECO|nr:hypothetical protein PR202_ga11468 [Eleusine coracana subsp. coracana]
MASGQEKPIPQLLRKGTHNSVASDCEIEKGSKKLALPRDGSSREEEAAYGIPLLACAASRSGWVGTG